MENYSFEELLELAKDDKNTDAQFALGNLYFYGSPEVKRNVDRAIDYYVYASEGGNSRAMYILYEIYRKGIAVEKDFELAYYYLESLNNSEFAKEISLFDEKLEEIEELKEKFVFIEDYYKPEISMPYKKSKHELDRMINEYQLTNNREILEQILIKNLRLISYTLNKYINPRNPNYWDYFQETVLSFFKAIKKIDVSKGFEHSTYVFYYLKQGIIRAHSKYKYGLYLPAHTTYSIYRYKVEKNNKENFRLEDFCKVNGIDIKTMISGLNFSNRKTFISLSIDDLGDSDNSLQDENSNLDDGLEKYDLIKTIDSILEKESENLVIKMHYGLGDFSNNKHTLQEIGNKLELSRERIRQIEIKALERLKRYFNKNNKQVITSKTNDKDLTRSQFSEEEIVYSKLIFEKIKIKSLSYDCTDINKLLLEINKKIDSFSESYYILYKIISLSLMINETNFSKHDIWLEDDRGKSEYTITMLRDAYSYILGSSEEENMYKKAEIRKRLCFLANVNKFKKPSSTLVKAKRKKTSVVDVYYGKDILEKIIIFFKRYDYNVFCYDYFELNILEEIIEFSEEHNEFLLPEESRLIKRLYRQGLVINEEFRKLADFDNNRLKKIKIDKEYKGSINFLNTYFEEKFNLLQENYEKVNNQGRNTIQGGDDVMSNQKLDFSFLYKPKKYEVPQKQYQRDFNKESDILVREYEEKGNFNYFKISLKKIECIAKIDKALTDMNDSIGYLLGKIDKNEIKTFEDLNKIITNSINEASNKTSDIKETESMFDNDSIYDKVNNFYLHEYKLINSDSQNSKEINDLLKSLYILYYQRNNIPKFIQNLKNLRHKVNEHGKLGILLDYVNLIINEIETHKINGFSNLDYRVDKIQYFSEKSPKNDVGVSNDFKSLTFDNDSIYKSNSMFFQKSFRIVSPEDKGVDLINEALKDVYRTYINLESFDYFIESLKYLKELTIPIPELDFLTGNINEILEGINKRNITSYKELDTKLKDSNDEEIQPEFNNTSIYEKVTNFYKYYYYIVNCREEWAVLLNQSLKVVFDAYSRRADYQFFIRSLQKLQKEVEELGKLDSLLEYINLVLEEIENFTIKNFNMLDSYCNKLQKNVKEKIEEVTEPIEDTPTFEEKTSKGENKVTDILDEMLNKIKAEYEVKINKLIDNSGESKVREGLLLGLLGMAEIQYGRSGINILYPQIEKINDLEELKKVREIIIKETRMENVEKYIEEIVKN